MSEPTPEAQAAAIKTAIFAGEKIAAIKLYREMTHVGLAEAKAAVEALEAELRNAGATAARRADDASDAVKAAIFAGEKIQAIKLYREHMKTGLAEAKTAVEAMQAALWRETPGSFKTPPKKAGCGMTLVVLALGNLALLRMWRELR
ncbi:MAG: ribosomal protein L7/L12 [Chthoniobacteraceae bacterium]